MSFINHTSVDAPKTPDVLAQEQELARLGERIEQAKEEFRSFQVDKEHRAQLSAEIDTLVTRKRALEVSIASYAAQERDIKERAEVAAREQEKSLNEAFQAIQKVAAERQAAQAEAANTQRLTEDAKKELASITGEVSKKNQASSNLDTAISQKQTLLDSLTKQYDVLTATVGKTKNEHTTLLSTIERLQQDIADLTKARDAIRDEVAHLDTTRTQQTQDLEAQKTNWEKQRTTQEADLHQRDQELAEKQGDLSLWEQRLTEKETNLKSIKSELERFYNRPIKINF